MKIKFFSIFLLFFTACNLTLTNGTEQYIKDTREEFTTEDKSLFDSLEKLKKMSKNVKKVFMFDLMFDLIFDVFEAWDPSRSIRLEAL